MEQHAAQTIAGILRADQVRQRERDFLGGREAILAVENHAVAAIQHEHGRAGALILGLMHVQIGIFQWNRNFEAFALDGRKQSLADVQVDRVAELVRLGSPAGFDASRQIARIVGAEARFPERTEQVLEGLESQKVNGFVGDLNIDLAIRVAGPALAGLAGLLLIGVDVTFVHQLLNQPVHQLVHLFRRHVFERLLNALGLFGIEHLALLERSLDRVLQVFERVLVPLAKGHVLRLETALQKEIGKRLAASLRR